MQFLIGFAIVVWLGLQANRLIYKLGYEVKLLRRTRDV